MKKAKIEKDRKGEGSAPGLADKRKHKKVSDHDQLMWDLLSRVTCLEQEEGGKDPLSVIATCAFHTGGYSCGNFGVYAQEGDHRIGVNDGAKEIPVSQDFASPLVPACH